LYLKFWAKLIHPFKNVDFPPIFARITSAITPNENSSVNMNRKSATGLPVSVRIGLD